MSAWYDNTKANKNNPDPDQWVGYGDRTVDEMAHAWMNVVYLNDDEYKALLAERKAKTGEDDERRTRSSSEPSRRLAVRRRRVIGRRRRSAVCSAAQQLPSEPRRQFGASITGAFEGWFDNPDGSRSFLVGYFNRNTQQALDVPIGPNNRIEPGGPDMGQPTHFLPGRQWGMFAVPVPKDFTPTAIPTLDDRRERPDHEHSAAAATPTT